MFCRNCGKEIDEKAEVCVKCGVKPLTSKMYCQNCGAETKENQVVCPECGVKLKSSIKPDKSKVVAGLLAIFLGSLGIHKFYLGYNVSGIVMLLITLIGSWLTFGITGGVIAIIALIEGILYLTKSDEDFENIYVENRRTWF